MQLIVNQLDVSTAVIISLSTETVSILVCLRYLMKKVANCVSLLGMLTDE